MLIKKLMFFGLFLSVALGVHAEEVPPEVNKLLPTLQQWGQNPILIAAVQAQNGKSMSLDEIKKQDAEWMSEIGVNDFMTSLMSSGAAKELKRLEASSPFYTELFLMDDQGANVAMTNKTSDYWQGDEAKFIQSFAEGRGKPHVGKVKFDESAQAYLVQVSIPMMDAGKAIGALTIGINLDELEAAGH